MLRHDMIETVGKEFLTSNIEAGEYSYVQEAGGKAKLEENNNYLDDLVKSINNKVILKDGGSIVYKKKDIYIVMCHRIGSLDADKTIEDIYLGDTYQDACLE